MLCDWCGMLFLAVLPVDIINSKTEHCFENKMEPEVKNIFKTRNTEPVGAEKFRKH